MEETISKAWKENEKELLVVDSRDREQVAEEAFRKGFQLGYDQAHEDSQ